jgi:hypothetical protein
VGGINPFSSDSIGTLPNNPNEKLVSKLPNQSQILNGSCLPLGKNNFLFFFKLGQIHDDLGS